MAEDIRRDFLAAILEADRHTAGRIIVSWAEQNGIERAVSEILEPVLEEIGRFWETSQSVSLAQAYVAGKIAEDFMTLAAEKKGSVVPSQSMKGPVIIANIEDDYHSLGRKMVGVFLRTNGWEVVDMGNDVPAPDLVNKALEIKARVIGVSAMMYTTAMNIRKLREEIDRLNLRNKIKIAVGGAVFRLRPELVTEVGGDGTAGNAILSTSLFDRLAAEALQGGEL